MPTYLAQRLRTSADELSVQWCNGLVSASRSCSWSLTEAMLGRCVLALTCMPAPRAGLHAPVRTLRASVLLVMLRGLCPVHGLTGSTAGSSCCAEGSSWTACL